MKVKRVEYAIMKDSQYVVEVYEPTNEGAFVFTPHIEDASVFPSAENSQKFVENNMHLNIANVSIHRVTHYKPNIAPLVKINGVFVDIKAVGYCNHEECKKPYYLMDLQYFQIDNDTAPQLYCSKHFEELDSTWNNSYHGNQDSDTMEVVK